MTFAKSHKAPAAIFAARNVRFGSLAEMTVSDCDVRITLESGYYSQMADLAAAWVSA